MSSDESESDSNRSIRRLSRRQHKSVPRREKGRRRRRSESSSSWSDTESSSASTSSRSTRSSWTSSSGESDGGEDEALESSISRKKWIMLGLVIASAVVLVFALFLAKSKSSSSPAQPSSTTKPQSSGQASSTRSATSTATGSMSHPPSDFWESLASSHSMTPAKVTDLPAPSTALPSPTPAAEFIEKSWPVSKASPSEFVNFIDDPIDAGSGDVVLGVMYPKGQYTGGEKGGASMRFNVFGEGKTRAMISYEVGFESNFDFVLGGKLAGLFGGDPSDGCTGGKGSEACFSARFMWRAKGEGEVYGYVPTYEGQCEEGKANASSIACHGKMGQSFNRGSFTFEAGKYNTLTEIIILNSDPSSTDTEANGYLAVYDGTTLAFERSDIVFRTNTSVFMSSVLFQTFFGGSTADYASTVLTHTYYKNWRFYEGEEASMEEGKQVVASIGS